MSDKESDNYYRLIRLVVKTGTRTVREVFKKHIAHDIASVLKSHWKNIKELKSKRVLTEPQYQLLNADTLDIEEFDISLLCILIRNICTNVETPPGTGWETVIVPSSDTTVGGYIIQICNVRNEVLCHLYDTRVSNDLFKKIWVEAEKCLKELAAHVDILDEITEEINKTESMPLTEDSNIKLEAALKKWGLEELYTSLGQLYKKADKQANKLQKTMDDVSVIRKKMEGGHHTGNSGSANQQTAPVAYNNRLLANTNMNQTKDVIERNKESDNYYRLITLVVKTGTRTIREVFKKHTAGDISSVLKTHRKQIDELNRNRILTDRQYQLLNVKTPDLDTFDISLLVFLIRNICTSVETPPGHGWKTDVVPSSDTTVGGYIIGIRNVRNEVVGHSYDTKVSKDLFKKNWSETEKCLKALAAHVGKTLTADIAIEIKHIESMPLIEDSNFNLEASLRTWQAEEIFTELNTAPVAYNYGLLVNTEMNQTKDVIENIYDGVCKALGIHTTEQQQTKALPPIVNPNALTDDEILKYSKQLGKDWEIFAIYLGYKQTQIDQLTATYPKQIQNLLRTMLQKWHDVVARFENENPRDRLAASFACMSDNRTAVRVLGDGKRLKDVKKMKTSPETKTKIEDIHFDVPSLTQIMHVVHHLGPSFESRNWTGRALEEQQKPGIAGAKTPAIEEGDQNMDET